MKRLQMIERIYRSLKELENGNQISIEDWNIIWFFIEIERDCKSNEEI
tara:strand:+ start:347 stop:490 length:144 start_codon:yes stop_codon:yes gene_type:complete